MVQQDFHEPWQQDVYRRRPGQMHILVTSCSTCPRRKRGNALPNCCLHNDEQPYATDQLTNATPVVFGNVLGVCITLSSLGRCILLNLG